MILYIVPFYDLTILKFYNLCKNLRNRKGVHLKQEHSWIMGDQEGLISLKFTKDGWDAHSSKIALCAHSLKLAG